MGYDKETLNKIYQKTGGNCHLCNRRLSRDNYAIRGARGAWNVDHSRPKAKGGTNHLNNLFPACISCNTEKGVLHKTTIRNRKGYDAQPAGGGGCFLTTACILSRGLPDNCHELEVLRKFRDEYVLHTHNGPELIAEYYQKAPLVVEKINSLPHSHIIYEIIYKNICNAVSWIEENEFGKAFNLYCTLSRQLYSKFIGCTPILNAKQV